MYFIKFFTVLEFLVCSDIPDQANRQAIYKNQYRKEDRKIRIENGRLRYPFV